MRFKTILLLFSLFNCCCFTLMAQQKVRFGVNAGMNFSKISGELTNFPFGYSFSYLKGAIGGVSAEIPLKNDHFFIQSEVNFSQVGSKGNLSFDTTVGENLLHINANAKIRMNYVSVPILFKYKTEEKHISFLAGLQTGYLISTKSTIEKQENAWLDFSGKKIDFGGVIGTEYFHESGVGVSFRYNFPFVGKSDNQNNINYKNIRTNNFSIMLGYRFP